MHQFLTVGHHDGERLSAKSRLRVFGTAVAVLSLVTGAGLAGVLTAVPAAATGTTFYVTAGGTGTCGSNSAGNGLSSIQAAITCVGSVGGDTIVVGPSGSGPYSGFGTVTQSNLTIEAAPGASAATVVVAGDLVPLVVDPGATAAVTGITVECASGCSSSVPLVTNEGALTLTAVTVNGENAASGDGGIANVTTGASSASLTVLDSTVINNRSSGYGGGISSKPASGASGSLSLIVANSTIADNASQLGGGGIYFGVPSATSTADIVNSTITANNAAQAGGGGIFVDPTIPAATVTLSNTVVAANTASFGIRGPDCSAAAAELTDGPGGHNLIGDGNGCPGVANAVNGDKVGVTALAAPLAGGTAYTAISVGALAYPIPSGTTLHLGATQTVTTSAAGAVGATTIAVNSFTASQSDPAGTPVSDPIAAGLQALAANGGPTETVALAPTSPAIGSGDAATCTAAPINNADQRGDPRNAATRGTCDIGAYDTGTGTTFHVTAGGTGTCGSNSAGNGLSSIQAAITCAGSVGGDTIVVSPSGSGPYPGFGTVTQSNLTIEAAPGANATTVVVAGNTTPLVVDPGAGAAVTGLTVECASGCSAPVPLVTNEGALTLTAVTVNGESANSDGGIANVTSGASSASLTVLDSTVINNRTAGVGGGISSNPASGASGSLSLSVANSTIAGNGASLYGGGIFVGPPAVGATSTASIVNSTITANSASGVGGGINDGSGGLGARVTLSNTIVAANTATFGGADCFGSAAELTGGPGGHNLIGDGAGCPGFANAVNGDKVGVTTLAAPLASGTDYTAISVGALTYPIPDGTTLHLAGSSQTVTTSAAGSVGATTIAVNSFTASQSDPAGAQVSDPIAARLQPLAANGGPTETVALNPSSPAIGSGDAATCTAAPINNLDQRGDPRNAATRGTCDIGAYDTGGAASAPLSITTTSVPAGAVGQFYSTALAAAGGTTPYTWALVSGSDPLPSGLTLSSAGAISGTPSGPAGTTPFTVKVTDSAAPAATATQALALTVNPAGPISISGTVYSTSGAPLPGICVYLYAAAGARTADPGVCTDAHGDYTMAVANPGSYDVAFYDPLGRYTTQWYDGASTQGSSEAVTLSAGKALTGIGVSMPSVDGTAIAGTVTDAATHAPIAGVCVYLYAAGGARTSDPGTCTNAAGNYVMAVANPGSYDVAFFDPFGRYFTTWSGGSATQGDATAVSVVSGGVMSGAGAAMTSVVAPGIAGSVTDSVTHAPIAGICVYLYTTAGARTTDPGTCTNAAGNYVMAVANPGSYDVAFFDPSATYPTQWSGGSYTQGGATAVTVTAGQLTGGVGAAMSMPGSITGTVTHASGGGAYAAVCVYADNAPTGSSTGPYAGIGACSDTSGSFTLSGFAPGTYKLGYYPPGQASPTTHWYDNASSEATAKVVTVTSGATTTVSNQAL